MKNNAFCKICGKPYYMCLSCKGEMSKTPWKEYTDTPECYKVYQILHGRFLKIYTTEEAKERLKNVDLSNLDNFYENIKNEVIEILNYESEEKKNTKEKNNKSKKNGRSKK